MEYKECWQIANIINGFVFKSSQYVAKGIRVIRIANVQDGYISDESPCYYPIEQEKNIGNAMLKENDLLMSLTGNVGRVAILDKSFLPAGLNQRVECLRPYDIKDNEYLYYYFRSKQFQMKAMSAATGSAQLNLSVEWVKKHKIPFYNGEFRESIVKELKTLDLALSIKKAALQSLDELVKSRFIEMFGDIDLSPQKSEWTKLSDLGTIYTGTTPSTGDETNWDGSILWITPAEMNDESFFIDNTIRKITEKGMKSKSLSLMPVGTVLLSTRAPIGKVGIVAKPMTCNQGFKNFYCPDKLNSIFLYVVLKNNTQYLNAIGTGTTFKEISKTTCGNIRVPVPPIELQNEFAKFVKLIDKSKFIVQQQIKDLQELLDSKMDEYFR